MTVRYGPRSFAVVGLSTWTSLPASTRDHTLTPTSFCRQLKTFLFGRAYSSWARSWLLSLLERANITIWYRVISLGLLGSISDYSLLRSRLSVTTAWMNLTVDRPLQCHGSEDKHLWEQIHVNSSVIFVNKNENEMTGDICITSRTRTKMIFTTRTE